jgi:hypothetical protein
MRRALIACAVVMAGIPAVAQAAVTQSFSTSQSEFTSGVRNQGWWSGQPTINNGDSNANYSASRGDGASEDNFFTFDLRGLSGSCTPQAATLRLTRFEGSNTGILHYGLWDVSTPAPILNNNVGFSPAIATDLSSGIPFGTFAVSSDPSLSRDEVLSFPLNAAGLAAIATARGEFFSIGGALATSDNGFLFGFSGDGNSGTQELVVTCGALPTQKDQCKNGGWNTYGVFKNQGDCVSFVATGGKNPPSGH